MSQAQTLASRQIPWGPVTDPGPEMWELIRGLDRRVQLQVANIVLETHIGIAKVHVEGLTKIQKALSAAKPG